MIPASTARDIAAQLINSGHVTSTGRAAIGAQVAAGTVARDAQELTVRLTLGELSSG
jgi:hypothetical protein